VNRKRTYTISEGSIQEDERQKTLCKVIMKSKELESEFKGLMPGGGSANSM
jgi:hypothetical protein